MNTRRSICISNFNDILSHLSWQMWKCHDKSWNVMTKLILYIEKCTIAYNNFYSFTRSFVSIHHLVSSTCTTIDSLNQTRYFDNADSSEWDKKDRISSYCLHTIHKSCHHQVYADDEEKEGSLLFSCRCESAKSVGTLLSSLRPLVVVGIHRGKHLWHINRTTNEI